MTIIEFLLARVADEEMLARDAASEGSPPRTGWQKWTTKRDTTPCGETLGPRGTVEAHPARVLAECAAKRTIVERFVEIEPIAAVSPGGPIVGAMNGLHLAVRSLAAVYADHPDYDTAWSV